VAESLTRLRVSTEVQAKATLTVRTREGDTVMLSTGRAARADLTSMAYDRTGRSTAPDLSLQLASTELNAIDAFEAVVEGDLSEQERNDLGALLTSIDDIAAAFFSDRIDQAVARAIEVRDVGSLQGYRFDASYSVSTYVEQDTVGDLAQCTDTKMPLAEPGGLAEAVEEFVAAFLRHRDDQSLLSLNLKTAIHVSGCRSF
jgi:hypothetical protein